MPIPNGAKSPEAPREPISGIHGMMFSLYNQIRNCTISILTQELPFDKLIIFNNNINLELRIDLNLLLPQACDLIRLICNKSNCFSGITVLHKLLVHF